MASVYSGNSVTAASSPFTPPSNSGTSTVGAASSPTVPIASVYSGASVTAASSPFTPPSNSGTSCTATSSPLTPPVNSGTSWMAGSLPLIPPGIPASSRLTGKLCMLSIAPSTISVTSWPISSFLTTNSSVFVSYWVKKVARFPFANLRTGAWFTKTSESNSSATILLPISTALFTFALVGATISLLKKSQLNFL